MFINFYSVQFIHLTRILRYTDKHKFSKEDFINNSNGSKILLTSDKIVVTILTKIYK